MVTAKEKIEEYIDYWGDCQKESIIEACIEYARLAIIEDRKNLLQYATVDVERSMGQKTGAVSVDEESILNAPMIELK